MNKFMQFLRSKKGKILSAVAIVVGIVGISAGVANATGVLSPGSQSGAGWDGKQIHICVQKVAPHTWYANSNIKNWNPDVCPSGQTAFHFAMSSAPTAAQLATAVSAYCAAHNQCAGPAGKNGTNGTNGAPGTPGAVGATGATGAAGPAGPAGKDGKDAQALPYGIGLVQVSRNGAAATTWETLSTTLGSPVGDTTSGQFRFTCTGSVPCQISVRAYTTASGYKVYPRVTVFRQNESGSTTNETYCEYADGSDNNGATTPVGTATTGTVVPLGIGSTADCGAGQAGGVVNEIDVPNGPQEHYDIFTTLVVSKA